MPILILRKFLNYLLGIMSNKSVKKNLYTFKLYKFEKIFPSNADQLEIPHPRSGHRIVCNENNLYVYGGYSPRYIDPFVGLQREYLFNELWQFNFATRKWMLLPGQETIPAELASVAVIFDGVTLMIYGGTSLPFGIQCSNKLYMCTLNKINFYHGLQLVEVKGNHPLEMYGQALVYHDGYLYTVGGTTGYEYTMDIHRLNLSTKVWEEVYIDNGRLEYTPAGRYRHEIGFDGTHIYIIGGGTRSTAYDLKHLPTFNIKDKVWESKMTKGDPTVITNGGIPEPRLCHSCVQYKDEYNEIYVYMVGGTNEPKKVFNELWRLHLRTLQWSRISTNPLTFSVYFNSACVTPKGKMCIFGGIHSNGFERTNKLHSAWIVIPKLSEMCWEAILHYSSNLDRVSPYDLLKMGIPLQYVNRLQNDLC